MSASFYPGYANYCTQLLGSTSLLIYLCKCTVEIWIFALLLLRRFKKGLTVPHVIIQDDRKSQ